MLLSGHIPAEKLTFGEVIGEGEFGSVFKGIYTEFNGQEVPVAIKTLREEQAYYDRDEFVREACVMMKLRHPCVVKLIGVSYGPPLSMVSNYFVSQSELESIMLCHL